MARAFKFGGVLASSCSNAVQADLEEALMEPPHHLTFGPFCLDVTHGRLWRGNQPIALRPRSLAVLQYLVEHPGRLLTKAELRQQVWAAPARVLTSPDFPCPTALRTWIWSG
jgi:DNA-binding response OmpR family regulator